MAINRKKEFARMIAMMVRKESVSFEPSDRVRLDRKGRGRDGQAVGYDVGEVYYDFDSGRMCCKLFNDKGVPVINASGPFFLDEALTSAELGRVSAKVTDYVERSIGRGMAISAIEDMVYNAPEMAIALDEKIRLFVDIANDGNLVAFTPEKIYDISWAMEDRREIMLSGKIDDGTEINVPLYEFSDMGLSTVYRNLEKSLRQEVAKGQDLKKAGDERRMPHPSAGPKL